MDRGRGMDNVIDFRSSGRKFGSNPTPEQLDILKKVFAIARLCHKLGMSHEERQKVLDIINEYTGIPVGITVSTSVRVFPDEDAKTKPFLLNQPHSQD